MSNTTMRPRLIVVASEAQPSGTRQRRAVLASVPPPKPTPPQQLSLQGVPARPDTLISLGLRDLDFATFASSLREHGVRIVLDLRVSSSFRGSGFSVNRVFGLFEANHIHYRRLPKLVDRRDEVPLNAHVRLRRYAAFLEEQKNVLLELRTLVRAGPALLLGWETDHSSSDRAILVEVLRRTTADPFELVVPPLKDAARTQG